MKNSTVLVTALFAGAAGVFTGILFAPGKGSKTRNKLSKKGHEYREFVSDNFDDLVHSVSHPFESVKDETLRLSKKANAKVRELRRDANQMK
jgi:gas vesicle protein